MAEIKLSDLPWGGLNNIQDNSDGLSGDRRRTNTTTALRLSVEAAYSRDTLNNINEFNGVIVSYRPVAYASYKNRTAMFENYVYSDNPDGEEEPKPKDYATFAYKVYIPELECRPVPQHFQDPVLVTYPDVYSDIEGTANLPLELGTLVAVKYEDVDNLFNPRIIRKVGGPIQIQNIASAELNKAFRTGIPAPLGPSGKKARSAGTPTPESPAGLKYKEFRNGTPEWTAIQIHYTVTFNTQDAIDVLAKRGLSYNYIIDKDGTVTTTVDPAKAVAIHAKGGWSARSIGISFVNLGYDSQYAGGGWGGRMSPPLEEWEQFPPHADRWEPYTPAAIQAGKTLVRQLVAQFPDIKTIFGHEETSDDKLDPGPAFDKYWPEYEALVPSGRGSIARSTKKRGSSSNA